jgi:hypothetical protein
MVAQIAVRGGSGINYTVPAGWTLVLRTDSGGTITQAIYSRVVPSSPPEPASYTWGFSAGNNAAGGIADYSRGDGVTPAVDVSAGQGNASSTNITAPSITVPAGHTSDRLLCLFGIANGSGMTLPAGMTQEWDFRAVSWGIGIGMSDVILSSAGATPNQTAIAASAAEGVGTTVALH